jgi:hypothetical protein
VSAVMMYSLYTKSHNRMHLRGPKNKSRELAEFTKVSYSYVVKIIIVIITY